MIYELSTYAAAPGSMRDAQRTAAATTRFASSRTAGIADAGF